MTSNEGPIFDPELMASDISQGQPSYRSSWSSQRQQRPRAPAIEVGKQRHA